MKILKRIIVAALLVMFITPTLATANNCVYWKRQINKVSSWSKNGGNARQQQDWQRQQSYLQSQLDKCQGTTPGPISVARGQAPSHSPNYTPATRLHSTNKDAELQQLIATCNRWIDIANSSNTFENQSIKDTACRAAHNKEAQFNNPTTSEIKIKRSIKECIKPNNVVDSEVKECMQGLKEPTWINEKN